MTNIDHLCWWRINATSNQIFEKIKGLPLTIIGTDNNINALGKR